MHGLRMRIFTDFKGLDTIEKGTGRLRTVGVFVDQGAGFTRSIPFLTTGDTGMATDAGIEVYNQG
jgi:hypothetical protein